MSLVLMLSGFLVLGSGCERKPTPTSEEVETVPVPAQAVNEAAAEAYSAEYWQAGQAQIIDAQAAAQALERAVAQLLMAPTEDHLESAKLAWLDAHREFSASMPFIEVAFAPTELQQQGKDLLLALNSWPVQAGYLDTVPGYSTSGIVNDTAIELTLTNLRKQHRLTAHEEASTGFHALEIMLWGPTSERSAEQFSESSGGEEPKAQASNRRRELTRLITQGISEDMAQLANRWPVTANDLSQSYLARDPVARLQRIRAAHIDLLRNQVLPRIPESSESDVESGLAANSKQALLAMLRNVQVAWLPGEGSGLADLLLDRHQTAALAETFGLLEERLLKMEDPIELAAPAELQRSRQQVEKLLGLISGDTKVPAREEEMTPVSVTIPAAE
ncbi:imelysin family protein [Microbulbifer sp. HZ11]|uniref:imelysin family protein n=1 Tax=Microbulbifer sp. HZ11 TaxID=1453501 RepID=UPI0005BA2967|nr:imelysin family protein [Microbulbifer sp. HZ11]